MCIEADVLQFSWQELARIQQIKYGQLFSVILMDPPWKIRLGLRYPLLKTTEIFSLPFHLLQDRGFVMIWALPSYEDKVHEAMMKHGYDKYGKVIWFKCPTHLTPVNLVGKPLRH